jgi:thioredoxin-like negative regulator of GroEL
MAGSETGTLLETGGGDGPATGPRASDGALPLKRRSWTAALRPIGIVLVTSLFALLCVVFAVWLWSFRWLAKGQQQIESRQYRAAAQTLSAFLRWHPGSSQGHFLLGGVYGQLNNWELALQQFRLVSPTAPEARDAMWRIGDVAMMLNRVGETEAALRRCLELDPKSLEARRGLIAVYRWQDRELDAEPLVWQAYERTSVEERPFLLAEWFRFRFAQRTTADTFGRLSGFLAAQPDDLQSAIAMGLWSMRQRQLGQARVLLEQVFTQFPDSPDARAAWASCLLESGEGETARQVLDAWPPAQQDVRYFRLKGIWLQDFAADYAAALDCLRRWVAHYPDDWQMRFRIGTCLRQMGDSAQAETETARAEELKGLIRYEDVDLILTTTLTNLHRPEQRHRMGEFYRSVGYQREARAWFELALALDPAFEPSRAALAGNIEQSTQ